MNRPAGEQLHKWDFGDGTTSAEQNPIHTFAKGGRFNGHSVHRRAGGGRRGGVRFGGGVEVKFNLATEGTENTESTRGLLASGLKTVFHRMG